MEEKTYTGYSLSERIRWIVAFSLIAVLLIGMTVSLVLSSLYENRKSAARRTILPRKR